jgi:hypothetical protein
MQEVNYPTPNCPVELFKLNQVQKELESPQAFAELVSDCQAEFDPTVDQGLQAILMLVGQLTKYHHDTLLDPDMDEWTREIWQEDYEALKKASALLRQVRAD